MKHLIAVLLIIPCIAFAQNTKTEKAVAKVMDKLRDGKNAQLAYELYVPENFGTLITIGAKYKNDTVAEIRKLCYAMLATAGYRSDKKHEQTSAVDQLSYGLLDDDSKLANYCARALQDFPVAMFSPAAKQNIEHAIVARKDNLELVVKLAGYLLLESVLHELELLQSQRYFGENVCWAAQLALARMGNTSAIAALKATIQKATVGDNMMYYLMPDILYTCQKELYKPFIAILYSEEKNCVTANPYNEKEILCGYKVMEKLAKYIKEYPLESYKSGSIKTDDYDAALKTLRTWFREKGDAFEINTNVF